MRALCRRAFSSDARVVRDVALRRRSARAFDAQREVDEEVLADLLAVTQVRSSARAPSFDASSRRRVS